MPVRNPGADARFHLLHANRDAIAVMLARAAVGGLASNDAVVVLVDQRDTVGRQLADAAADKAGLEGSTEAERIRARDEIPTVIIVVPVIGAQILLDESHPEACAGLAHPPVPGRVRVVVVAEGAAMLVHAAVPPPTAMPLRS